MVGEPQALDALPDLHKHHELPDVVDRVNGQLPMLNGVNLLGQSC